MSLLSDIFDSMRTNKKIDRIKKEQKLEARTQELVSRYGISEEEAAAKARLENRVDGLIKTVGKIAPPKTAPPAPEKKSSGKNKDDEYFGDLGFKI